MLVPFRFAFLVLLLATLAGCSGLFDDSAGRPTPEEMRQALKNLLRDRPDISIPEFQLSLDHEPAVVRDGMVYIGVWNCDPKLMTFEAVFSAPNITLYEVSGRFQMDNRGIWVAIPRRVLLTQKRDVGEFWRPHEVAPY